MDQADPLEVALAGDGVLPGLFVMEFASRGIGRIAAAAGAEFVVYDTEHTGWTMETVAPLLATTPVPALVRVPAVASWFCGPVLDAGARGVMAPAVGSAGEAEALVAACRYPPEGRRGLVLGYAHDGYRATDPAETIRRTNRSTVVIAQIETVQGVRNADAIAAVPGVAVLWVGHNDLTASLGIPGQFTHPDYLAALDAVLAACRRHGKLAGFNAGNPAQAAELVERGFRMISYGDLSLFAGAVASGVRALRT